MSFAGFSFKKSKGASRNTVMTATSPSSSTTKETVVVMKPSQMVTDTPVYVTRKSDVIPNGTQDHPTTGVSKSFIQAGVSQVQMSQGFSIERMGIFTDAMR